MHGAHLKYKKLGELMRTGREKQGMTLEAAASMIGMTNGHYLWRCESAVSNFPLANIARAADLYGLEPQNILDAIMADYQKGMRKALGLK